MYPLVWCFSIFLTSGFLKYKYCMVFKNLSREMFFFPVILYPIQAGGSKTNPRNTFNSGTVTSFHLVILDKIVLKLVCWLNIFKAFLLVNSPKFSSTISSHKKEKNLLLFHSLGWEKAYWSFDKHNWSRADSWDARCWFFSSNTKIKTFCVTMSFVRIMYPLKEVKITT